MRSSLALVLGLGLALAGCTAAAGSAARSPGAITALVGGTVYADPADEPIRDGVVLIHDGRIAALGRRGDVQVPAGAEVIECAGRTVTAGFWNSHMHFFERKWAGAAAQPVAELERELADTFARHGFTSVFDTGSPWDNTRALRERIESGEVAGPRIRSTGEALVAPGAMPSESVLRLVGSMTFPAPEVADDAQAAAAARRLLERGTDGIKVHLQPPPAPGVPMAESAIRAVVAEAHRAAKPVFVHPATSADVLAAIRSGADVVAHTTPRSAPWDASVLAEVRERGVALTPTLTLWTSVLRHDRSSTRDGVAAAAVEQLRAWVAAGGAVLFGTDTGANESAPVEEVARMAEAGLGFRAILASLTTAPAERFGDGARLGRIAPGFEADLVVLDGDPAGDVLAFARVRMTLRAGKVLFDAAEHESDHARPATP